MGDCKRCSTQAYSLDLPSGFVIGQYCADCHAITIPGNDGMLVLERSDTDG